jgi:hypothetical protein
VIRFFGNFYMDSVSFWVGVFIGGLAFFILSRLLPIIFRLLDRWFKPLQSQLQMRGGTTEFHYRNDLLKQAQHQHLAHQLFPLDDLIISPRLIVPPPIYEPGVWSTSEDITFSTLPFLIDWPELASTYNARSCTLAEALKEGANLVVIGQPGSGKTVALADFASQVVRKSTQASSFHDHLILLLHICDLYPLEKSIEKPLDKIIEVVTQNASRQIQKRLPKWINFKVSDAKAILLLDGLDELPRKYFDQAVNLISTLINQNPNIQIVATASPEYTGNLNHLGFIPIPVASWDKTKKIRLVDKWEKAWTKSLYETNQYFDIDTALINSWLILDQLDETPLELTLKLWAAYAGDVLGAAPGNEIFAHLMRLSKRDKQSLQAMGQIALQMISTEEPFLSHKDIENWAREWNQKAKQMATSAKSGDAGEKEEITISGRAAKELPNLIDANIARECFENRIIFSYPSYTSYLAAHTIHNLSSNISVFSLPEWNNPLPWATHSQTFRYLPYDSDVDAIVNKYLQFDDELLHFNLLKISRWLKSIPNTSQWYGKVLRGLAAVVQKEDNSVSLRARALLALISTGDSGIAPFIKGMLGSGKATFRQLAALGCGLLQDTSAIDTLTHLLSDPVPAVHRAASLALVNIGSRTAIDAVAYSLLNGNEQQRQAAAEAIANHPIESVSILQEGSGMDDLSVRRAVVFGLKRVAKPWAKDILQKLAVEEKEWVVRDAAMHAVEALSEENTVDIFPLKPPSETPWLLAFAGERGFGISPGSSANDLISMALNEGNEEQKLAALSYLKIQCEPISLEHIIRLIKTGKGEIKESAFNTIWQFNMAGIEIEGVNLKH